MQFIDTLTVNNVTDVIKIIKITQSNLKQLLTITDNLYESADNNLANA